MKYTAGELRKMNGRKCKLQYCNKQEAEWEIDVLNWVVRFVTNCNEYDDIRHNNNQYKYCWLICSTYVDDNYISDNYSITFLDEPHQNIYYDDNGEIIREWDWVLVCGGKEKRIFLWKIPRRIDKYFCVNEEEAELYKTDKEYLWASSRSTCIKYKEPEKKLRELMLTDEEYEEVKNKYK